MNKSALTVWLGALTLSIPAVVKAQDTPPSQKIDALIEASYKQHNVKPNAPTNDETFCRRIYLDVIGRIPNKEELTAFLSDTDAGKRAKLVDKLLESDGYVSHTYNWWADILRIQTEGMNGRGGEVGQAYSAWVKNAIKSNMPYDTFVRSLVTAKGYVWENGAVGYYIRDAGMPLDNMSNTAQIFLGTRVVCAQCHNHPFDHWKQTDYYEMAAFTYGVETEMGPANINPEIPKVIAAQMKKDSKQAKRLGRKDDRDRDLEGLIKDIIEPLTYGVGETKKELKLPADYKEGREGYEGKANAPIVKAKALFGADRIDKPAQMVKVDGDMRDDLANWLCTKENPRFTTVIANRLWKRAFGMGLIEPVDDFKDDTLASNQPLMKYLQETLVRDKYDMKKLMRYIFNTRTYQRECTPGDVSLETAYYFPGPILRRMTGEQVWDSVVTLMIPNPDGRKKGNGYQDRLAKMKEAADELKAKYVDNKRDGAEQLVSLAMAMRDASKSKEGIALAAKIAEVRKKITEARAKKDEKTARELQPELTKLTAEEATLKYKAQAEKEKEIDAKMKKDPFAGKPLAMDPSKKSEGGMKDQGGMMKGEDTSMASSSDYIGMNEMYYRASELTSPAPAGHFLREFGQSERLVIENSWNDASVTQALTLMNGAIFEDLTGNKSQLYKTLEFALTPSEKATKLWLTVLGRNPTEAEKQLVADATKGKGKDSWKDVFWALINGREFIFIQ